MVIVISNPACE